MLFASYLPDTKCKMKEYSKGIYVKFKPEEVDILHNRMQEAGVQNMSAYIRKMALNGYVIIPEWPDLDQVISLHSKVNLIQKNVEQLSENFISEKDVKNFVIYKGQKLEADIAYIEIYQQAKKSIYVVDDYMNAKSLQHLSQKADGVEVVLFTENGKGGKGFLTKSLVTDFQNEYPSLQIKPNPDCHDRLIVLDYGEETELVYHCGASSKDAGKKLCAINQITENAIIHPVIDRLLLLPDKQI